MLRIAGTDGFGWDLLKIFVNSFYNCCFSGYISSKTFFIQNQEFRMIGHGTQFLQKLVLSLNGQ